MPMQVLVLLYLWREVWGMQLCWCSKNATKAYRYADAYADAWAIIHNNLQAALAATRVTDGFSGATYNSGAKAAARRDSVPSCAA